MSSIVIKIENKEGVKFISKNSAGSFSLSDSAAKALKHSSSEEAFNTAFICSRQFNLVDSGTVITYQILEA